MDANAKMKLAAFKAQLVENAEIAEKAAKHRQTVDEAQHEAKLEQRRAKNAEKKAAQAREAARELKRRIRDDAANATLHVLGH